MNYEDRKQNCTNVIMDRTGDVQAVFEDTAGNFHLDPHDFEIVEDGRMIIQLGNRFRNFDNNTFIEGGFQTTDMATQQVEFEWYSMSGIPREETLMDSDLPDYL